METGNIYLAFANAIFLFGVTSRYKRLELSREQALTLALLMLFTGAIGARVWYAVFNGIPMQQALDIASAHRGGFSILGAITAAFLLLIIFSRAIKKPAVTIAGEVVPVWCAASIFWRLRCHFSGCCYGAPTRSEFLGNLIKLTGGGEPGCIPLPLFEMLFLAGLFIWLTVGISYLARWQGLETKKYHLLRIISYFSAYGIFRLLTHTP